MHRELDCRFGHHTNFLGQASAQARAQGDVTHEEYAACRRVQRAANAARHSPFAAKAAEQLSAGAKTSQATDGGVEYNGEHFSGDGLCTTGLAEDELLDTDHPEPSIVHERPHFTSAKRW